MRPFRPGLAGLLGVALVLLCVPRARADLLRVIAAEPARNALGIPVDATIILRFDRAVDPASITCGERLYAIGRWSGLVRGRYEFRDGNTTVRLVPARPFAAGEPVLVLLANQVTGEDGSPLRRAGYAFRFWTAVAPGPRRFAPAGARTTNVGGESSRPYGGVACDLDGDRFPDVAVVNEDTSDVRVLRSAADCRMRFHPVDPSPARTGAVPSPSEGADFDRDGNVDLCVANVGGGSVSILLGRGDGTFEPHQEIPSGDAPRGIAVLDFDADGDLDVAAANVLSDDISLFANDGTGVFAAAGRFEAGVDGEWALAAEDMNGDAVLDLVVGGVQSETIAVLLGRGDGVFEAQAPVAANGPAWMLVTGDVDGDGRPDVATADGVSDQGSIFRNLGGGNLGAPVSHPMTPFVTASDLGDLDGDGDLDWVTSSFGGAWNVLVNEGGAFTADFTIPAPQAASCALLVDLDLDHDLDLALVDELADVVLFYRNEGAAEDCNGNGLSDVCEVLGGNTPDCDGNGFPDSCDIEAGRSEDGNRNGIPDACETAVVACGAGAVDAACGTPVDVLFLSGSSGGPTRTVILEPDAPLVLAIHEPPSLRCDGDTTLCVVYAWRGTPRESDIVPLPRGLGSMCYGPPAIGTRLPKRTWNSLRRDEFLGPDDAPGPRPILPDGGSFGLVTRPGGAGRTISATLQGLIEDACSTANVPASVTNGIRLLVR